MLFYPIYGSGGFSGGESVTSSAHREARQASTDVEDLRGEVDRLRMIAEALWEILKQQHGYDDEELIKRVTEIDLRDGKLDGRVAPTPPEPCPECGRVTGRNRPRCIYCGVPLVRAPFES